MATHVKRKKPGGCPHQDGAPCADCQKREGIRRAYDQRHEQLLNLPSSRFKTTRALRLVLRFDASHAEFFFDTDFGAGSPLRAEFDLIYTTMIERERHVPVPAF